MDNVFDSGTGPAVGAIVGGRGKAVAPNLNPRYCRIVEKFGEATGVPMLLNTSFNLRGEPIVNSPADAFNTFSGSGIDVLVLDHFVVSK